MLGSYGLKTYIWNNRLKSIFLLAGFPVLLLLICFGFAILISAFSDPTVDPIPAAPGKGAIGAWPGPGRH